RAVAVYTEVKVEGDLERLRWLAQSERLARDDLRGFTEQLRAFARDGDFLTLALVDAHGRLRASTAKLFVGYDGKALASADYVRRVVQMREPYVSDVVVSPFTGDYRVMLAVPVLRADRVA